MKKKLLTSTLAAFGLMASSMALAMNTVPYVCLTTGTAVIFSGVAPVSELPALESSCPGRFVAGASFDGVSPVPYTCLGTTTIVLFSGQATPAELPALANSCPGRFVAGSLPVGP